MIDKLNLNELKDSFKTNIFRNEDDIKINFHSDIIKPILKIVNPLQANQFSSENRLLSGGRTDATFQNISFEYKRYDYFKSQSGIEEAVFGRTNKEHGLYDYILGDSEIKKDI